MREALCDAVKLRSEGTERRGACSAAGKRWQPRPAASSRLGTVQPAVGAGHPFTPTGSVPYRDGHLDAGAGGQAAIIDLDRAARHRQRLGGRRLGHRTVVQARQVTPWLMPTKPSASPPNSSGMQFSARSVAPCAPG